MAKKVGLGIEGETPKKTQTFFSLDAPIQVGLDTENQKRKSSDNSPKRKRVSVSLGVEGQTPTKVQLYDKSREASSVYLASPSRSLNNNNMMPSSSLRTNSKYPLESKDKTTNSISNTNASTFSPQKKSVHIGDPGETPQKTQFYSYNDAPAVVDLASPERVDNINPKGVLTWKSKYTDVDTNNSSDMFTSPENNKSILSRPKTSRGKARPSPDEFASYVIPSDGDSPDRDTRNLAMSVHNNGGSNSNSNNNYSSSSSSRSRLDAWPELMSSNLLYNDDDNTNNDYEEYQGGDFIDPTYPSSISNMNIDDMFRSRGRWELDNINDDDDTDVDDEYFDVGNNYEYGNSSGSSGNNGSKSNGKLSSDADDLHAAFAHQAMSSLGCDDPNIVLALKLFSLAFQI